MKRAVRIFYDAQMIDHDPGPGHPESPGRLRAIEAHLAKHFPTLSTASAPAAGAETIKQVHRADYVDRIVSLRGKEAILDPDTIVGPPSVDAALLAAGQAVAAVEYTVENKEPSFALVRPPGHHAEKGRAMGFCIFNNIAVAAAHGLTLSEIERVLIVDWDVHHGNGTQSAFYDRDDVLFFSTHQSPFYPGTGLAGESGAGKGKGFTINVPLPAGTGDERLIEIFESRLVPAAKKFQPDLVLISAGFDAHRLDPIGGMEVTTEGFGRLLSIVDEIAGDHASGRIALVLEGGYHQQALARCVGRCIQELTG